MLSVYSKAQICLSSRLGGERAASLILVSMAITIIIGIVGLAIDLNIGLSATTDQQEVSNALASAALEAYLGDNSADQTARVNTALARITELARLPQNRGVFKSFTADSSFDVPFCVKLNPTDSCAATDQGILIPGLYVTEGNTLHSCPPNPSDPASQYPCFLPGLPSGEDATAFQVELQQTNASPIRTLFARAFGIGSLRTRASSTAAAIPRKIVMAVDISGSVVGTTHNQNGVTADRRMMAYKLDPSISCDSNHRPVPDPCAPHFNVGPDDEDRCHGIVRGIYGFDMYNVMWFHTDAAPPGWPSNPVRAPKTQYKSDYQCWRVNDDGTGQGPTNYLIDLPDGRYTAEPLSSILRAMDSALDTLRARRNAGDGVQIQFFDTTILSNDEIREIPELPAAPAPFAMASIDESDPKYQDIRAITSGDLEALITRHAIFPRIVPMTVLPIRNPRRDQVGGVFSNVSYSAWRAFEALTRNANVYARRNVVLFSDFLVNCWGHEPDPFCMNSHAVVLDAIYHLNNQVVWDNYPQNKIAFNPIVFGDYVAPHTTLPMNGEGTGCMWDTDAIRMNIGATVVNGYGNPHSYVNTWTGLSQQAFPPDPANGTYFYQGNMVYDSALRTGGEWGVIRPCCRRGPGNACADVKAVLDWGCADLDGEIMANDPPGCPLAPSGNHCKAGYADDHAWYDDPDTGHASPYIGEGGRLLCDPQGRDEGQQMTDYMTHIVGSNSIVLVETKQTFGG